MQRIGNGFGGNGLGLVLETLMTNSDDEAFTEYGLIAGRIEMPADRSWVIFTLRPEARWHDGTPITVADVIFSFEALTTKGNPFYRVYYGDVQTVEDLGERRVKFTFKGEENRELPLIMGQLPVISKAYYEARPFEETTLEPPLASGPYRVEAVEPGRAITYRRVADYWGADLAVNRGRHNFETIRFDYYRDGTVAVEAFKAHAFDFWQENTAKVWATAYSGPQFESGLAIREEIPNELPTGMQGFVFNTRRAIFADVRVREAIGYAFDFEWTNRNLFYGAYTRTGSFFSNSELASSGLPDAAELALLEPYRDQLPEAVFTKEYTPPATDGSGNNRSNLRHAARLLDAAGWVVEEGRRVNAESGEPLSFEFLIVSPAFERIIAPLVRGLKRLGIEARIRVVDTSQYQNRIDSFDFDVVVNSFGQSLSPGNEQREFWGSAAADVQGSRNLIGIKDPVVDALIENVVAAPDREGLIAATRALDRVLLWRHFLVPQWHVRVFRIVYWNKFGRPAISPKYALGFTDTWWVDPDKARALEAGAESLKGQ
jgi:microcin C transport system substrate-binding protein